MKTLGLDIGERRIGVAVSDELGVMANALCVIDRRRGDAWARLGELVAEHGVEKLVVGLPLNMDGTRSTQTERVVEWARTAEDKLGLPTVLWDERLSTAQAEKTLLSVDMSRKRRKEVIDKVAAALILQSYLDSETNSDRKEERRQT